MNKRIPVADAIAQLRQAGYYVEFTTGIVYVRKRPTSMPDRLYTTKGNLGEELVSERQTQVLVNMVGVKVSG